MSNNDQIATNRVTQTNLLVDEEARELLKDIAVSSQDVDSLIDIVKDRVVKSDDVAQTIALTRLLELKNDLYKKRTDILKALISDKSVDIGSVRRNNAGDYGTLEGILGGAMMGAAAIAMASNSRVNPNLPYIDTSQVETIDTSTIEVEIDNINVAPKETREEDLASGVENILNGN